MSAVLKAVQAFTGQVMREPAARSVFRDATTEVRRVSFRFGLTGLCWGAPGPAVLLAFGPGTRPARFRYLIEALVASGRQVFALDALAPGTSSQESALALAEAGVEIPELEAVIAHGAGAEAAVRALGYGLRATRAVLIAPPAAAVELARDAQGPALVIHDMDDHEAPFADGAAVADAWRHAHFLATTGLGHWRVLGDANVVHGIAEFLDGHEAGLTSAQLMKASA